MDRIIVTGSRIAVNSAIANPNPVSVVTAEDIERTGDTNIVDTLIRNPALVNSYDSSAASGQNAGIRNAFPVPHSCYPEIS